MAHWDRSSKDARLAFYQTADVKKLKYDDLAPEIVSEVDPECLEALIKLLIAMLKVQVNLCLKHLFSHQLTHNMTKDCSLNYKFNT